MDLQVLQAFMVGDESAFTQIIEEMTKPLMKYCYNILLNIADAEDAVQTAFIKSYFKRSSIRNPEALITFLYRVAYRSSIDIIRKRNFITIAKTTSNQNLEYISKETYTALKTLPPLDRALVYGRAVNEISYSELASIHGKSEQYLRKRYERAKKKLAKILQPENFKIEPKISKRRELL